MIPRIFVLSTLMLFNITSTAQSIDTTMMRVREGMASMSRKDTVVPLISRDTTTTIAKTDSTQKKKTLGQSPKKAAIYSAILPGMGQAYNKRYWKIPIVYAGLGFGGYIIYFNTDQYQLYRDLYYNRVNGIPIDPQYDFVASSAIKNARDIYNKRRQQSWIYTGIFYFVQVADAFVDAHLSGFDVSDDLSIRPAVFEANGFAYSGGIGLKIAFK